MRQHRCPKCGVPQYMFRYGETMARCMNCKRSMPVTMWLEVDMPEPQMTIPVAPNPAPKKAAEQKAIVGTEKMDYSPENLDGLDRSIYSVMSRHYPEKTTWRFQDVWREILDSGLPGLSGKKATTFVIRSEMIRMHKGGCPWLAEHRLGGNIKLYEFIPMD